MFKWTQYASLVLVSLGVIAYVVYVSEDTKLSCTGSESEQLKCLTSHFQSLVKAKGAEFALNELEVRFQSDPIIRERCHTLSHEIAHAAADVYPTLEDAYSKGNPFCWDGYYHGVIESVVTKEGRDYATQWLAQVCTSIEKTQTLYEVQACAHGVGHGAMKLYENRLNPSLSFCDSFSDMSRRESCLHGVFMADLSTKGPTESPLYPCDTVGITYAPHCFPYRMGRILKDIDARAVFGYCEEIKDRPSRQSCNESVGRAAVLSDVEKIQTNSDDFCTYSRSQEQRRDCYNGIVKQMVRFYRAKDQAVLFCRSIESEFRDTCATTASEHYEKIFQSVPK